MAYRRDYGTTSSRIFLGEDKTLYYTVYEQGDLTDEELDAAIDSGQAVPVNVATFDLMWVLRRKPSASDPALIEKVSFAGVSVVGVYDADPGANTQKIAVMLEDTDSYDPTSSPAVALSPTTYWYSLKRMDAGLETVLVFGKLTFMQATAR